ncbi:MAG: ATP-binding protein [Myxococcaceae bacterium]
MVPTDQTGPPGNPRRSAAGDALALLGETSGAVLVTLDQGVIEQRWCARDLPAVPLPAVGEETFVTDTRTNSRFAHHPLTARGVICLFGVPVGQGLPTLWVGADQLLDERALTGARRCARVLAQVLGGPTEAALFRRFTSLMAAPAVYVHEGALFINRAVEALTGFDAHELSTLDRWFESLFGEDAPTLRATYELDRAHAIDVSRITSLRRKDGEERMVELSMRREGEHELWLLQDVTERVASQERFRALFEQTSTALTLYDQSGIVDCNPAAAALLGYHRRSQLLEKRPEALSDATQADGRPAPQVLAQMETIAITQGSHRFDWVFKKASGEKAPVEVTLTPLTLGTRRVLLAEWHDISERLHYEAGLQRALSSALSFAQARSDFLATMSHEIRTPMNGVIGMTRLLAETQLDPQQREYVNTVRACGEGLLALINDVLDFSKLEAGKLTLERIPFSVREVVEDAVAVLAPLAHGKGLELCCRVAPRVPARIWGDPTRLRQVLLNLASNAVKFTATGQVQVRVDVDGARLTFDVVDTGVGIAPEALPRLFSAFSQEDSSTTRRFGGSGLGLAICKRLTALMKGSIDVQTGAGGSRFTVSMPLEAHTQHGERPALQGFRVGIVEPRDASRAVMVELVEATGARVVEDAKSADVVLIDQAADGGHGMDLVRAMRALGKPAGLLRHLDGKGLDDADASFVLPTPVREHALHQQLARALLEAPLSTAPTPTYRQFNARILVAEDNVVNQRVVRGLLAKLGCEVVIAENGARALEAFGAGDFDLVFMDCQMPELDGFEATRRIRAIQQRHVPIVALTAGVMVEDRERCLSAGMDAFLVKPVRIEDLSRTLDDQLRAGALLGVGT